MSLAIDSNLEYLRLKLGISSVTFQEKYSNLSIDEIVEAEAASGNQNAIALAQEILTNTALVIELFNLADENNKYMILREMSSQQLEVFLPEMDEKTCIKVYFSLLRTN